MEAEEDEDAYDDDEENFEQDSEADDEVKSVKAKEDDNEYDDDEEDFEEDSKDFSRQNSPANGTKSQLAEDRSPPVKATLEPENHDEEFDEDFEADDASEPSSPKAVPQTEARRDEDKPKAAKEEVEAKETYEEEFDADFEADDASESASPKAAPQLEEAPTLPPVLEAKEAKEEAKSEAKEVPPPSPVPKAQEAKEENDEEEEAKSEAKEVAPPPPAARMQEAMEEGTAESKALPAREAGPNATEEEVEAKAKDDEDREEAQRKEEARRKEEEEAKLRNEEEEARIRKEEEEAKLRKEEEAARLAAEAEAAQKAAEDKAREEEEAAAEAEAARKASEDQSRTAMEAKLKDEEEAAKLAAEADAARKEAEDKAREAEEAEAEAEAARKAAEDKAREAEAARKAAEDQARADEEARLRNEEEAARRVAEAEETERKQDVEAPSSSKPRFAEEKPAELILLDEHAEGEDENFLVEIEPDGTTVKEELEEDQRWSLNPGEEGEEEDEDDDPVENQSKNDQGGVLATLPKSSSMPALGGSYAVARRRIPSHLRSPKRKAQRKLPPPTEMQAWDTRHQLCGVENELLPKQLRAYFSRPQSLPELKDDLARRKHMDGPRRRLSEETIPYTKPTAISADSGPPVIPHKHDYGGHMKDRDNQIRPWNNRWSEGIGILNDGMHPAHRQYFSKDSVFAEAPSQRWRRYQDVEVTRDYSNGTSRWKPIIDKEGRAPRFPPIGF